MATSCLCCKGDLGFCFLLFSYNLHGLDLGFVSVSFCLVSFFFPHWFSGRDILGSSRNLYKSQSLRDRLKLSVPYIVRPNVDQCEGLKTQFLKQAGGVFTL